jgi:amino acid transporter
MSEELKSAEASCMTEMIAVEFPAPGGRTKKKITTGRVIVLVIAAAAPLAAVIGNAPLALSTDAALSFPAVYLLVGLTLLAFAAGYSKLSQEFRSKGAFYTQVGQGLGRPAGVIAAYCAAFAYAAYSVGMAAAFGYFASLIATELGATISWMLFAAGGVAVVAVMGFRSLDLSANILIGFMLAEFLILIVFDLCVIATKDLAAFPLDVWSMAHIANPGIGAIIPFAVVSFIGFEAAALYGEETHDPSKSIPAATFTALGLIMTFYMLSTWIIIGAAGVADVQALAKSGSGNFIFSLAQAFGGDILAGMMGLFLIASILASYLAIHNAASRYFFALASDKLLPSSLAAVHADHHAPHVASLVMTMVEFILVIGLGMFGAAPYVGIASGMIGLGTIGIIAMQIACSLAVVGFFVKAGRGGIWTTRILPLLGAAGLLVFLVAIFRSYSELTGSDIWIVNHLPWIFVPLVAAAFVYALWLKRNRPNAYAQVASASYRFAPERTAPLVPVYSGRYCIIGAGPSGLVMARAFLKEGIPFDCFERHGDLGGLWDIENPGTPLYDSAHFISSKWTSYFYGFPMPDDYPDYPSGRQILAYIRAFATAYGLREHITFNSEVKSATQEKGQWRVELSTGEIRYYDGVIACPGVTWHASMPNLKGAETFTGDIRHSVSYRSVDEFRGKRVLIVGAGNSGVDIACDAARSSTKAFLSVRRGYRFVPKHICGIPTDLLASGKVLPPKGAPVSTDLNAMLDTMNGDLTRFGLPRPDHDALASHPILNDQILHYLGHGDLIAKGDVTAFAGNKVLFADGSEEVIDIVMFCTGYEYKLPFFDKDLFDWKQGRPQLYFNIMSREHRGLYVLGFIEFADAGYRRFDEMAQLVVADINARETGVNQTWFDDMRRSHRPDMRGGKVYVDSPRHANYVHTETYIRLLADMRRALGWPDLDDSSFDSIKVQTENRVSSSTGDDDHQAPHRKAHVA